MKLIAKWKCEEEPAYNEPSALVWEDGSPATMDDYQAHLLDTHSLHEGADGGMECHMLFDLMEQRGDDFEFAWSEFCHEFYRHKGASFFEVPPPDGFSTEFRALLAGAAEFWCREFGLPVPAWTEEPQYFLDEWWTPWGEFLSDAPERVAERRAKADPAFLRRNILFAARNLIAL